MHTDSNAREQRGREIARISPDQVTRIDKNTYKVQSQSNREIKYDVVSTELGWICSCPDSMFRQAKCKHVFAVELSQALRRSVTKIDLAVNPSVCIYCKSPNITRYGVRHNKSGNIQVYSCKDCKHFFTHNVGFEHMQASPQAITGAMQLYFSGESLRNVQKFLLLQGIRISHVTVLNWIHKYVSLMEKYVEKITPQVSQTWRTDELYLKIKGNKNYLFALMDDETRFWIAQQVADKKGISNIRPMFQEAREITDVEPKTIISDGAQNFVRAIMDEFPEPSNRPVHIREIRIDGSVHNNKMERMNGELRDREKVMRSLKNKDSPILKGLQIYHNYMRPHMSLQNKTPAEVAGIQIEGENKWLTLIQSASIEKLQKRYARQTRFNNMKIQ